MSRRLRPAVTACTKTRLFRAWFPWVLSCVSVGAGTDTLGLHVYYPSPSRPRAIQERMSEALPGLDVTVFGRHNDFAEQTRKKPPDALLGPYQCIISFKEYSVLMEGMCGGTKRERYLLMTPAGERKRNDGRMTVGAVDILGKNETESFVARFFSTPPSVRRVIRVEDLLPLLTFGMADAILVPKRCAVFIDQMSSVPFDRREMDYAPRNTVTLAAKPSGPWREIRNAVREMPDELKSMFGIDGWEE